MEPVPGICAEIESFMETLRMSFATKPLVFGGAAMEYYGLRKRGHDIDFIVSFEDFEAAAASYPGCKKDMWGDWGIVAGEFELFRTVWKLDLDYLAEGSVEFPKFRMISIDRLLLMKALALDEKEKSKTDFDLVLTYIKEQHQRPDIVAFMNAHVPSYLNSPDGFIYNDNY